ncbi:LOW QUALITY PROTEIN: hypothetical protein YC2023_024479 [Brassica napus]
MVAAATQIIQLPIVVLPANGVIIAVFVLDVVEVEEWEVGKCADARWSKKRRKNKTEKLKEK